MWVSRNRLGTVRKARTKSPKERASKPDKEQSERFIQTARELAPDAEKSPEAFDRAIDVLLKGRGP